MVAPPQVNHSKPLQSNEITCLRAAHETDIPEQMTGGRDRLPLLVHLRPLLLVHQWRRRRRRRTRHRRLAAAPAPPPAQQSPRQQVK